MLVRVWFAALALTAMLLLAALLGSGRSVAQSPSATRVARAVPIIPPGCAISAIKDLSDQIVSLKPPLVNEPAPDLAFGYAQTLRLKLQSCGPPPPNTPVCTHALLVAVKNVYKRMFVNATTPWAPLPDPDVTVQAERLASDVVFCGAGQSSRCQDLIEIATLELLAWMRDHAGFANDDAAYKAKKALVDEAVAACQQLQVAASNAVDSAVCERKRAMLPQFIEDYYGSVAPMSLAHGKRLTIEMAVYGDLVHGHVCNATTLFKSECARLATNVTTAQDDASGSAGPGFCLLRASTPPFNYCGFDPSPQADNKEVLVHYKCGDDEREARLPYGTTKINLVCGYPYRRTRPTDAVLAAELAFLNAKPCEQNLVAIAPK